MPEEIPITSTGTCTETSEPGLRRGWQGVLRLYGDRQILKIAVMGFVSGVPLLLVTSTLMARLTVEGIDRPTIGLFALVQLPYACKFLWSPLFDSVPPPLRLGRRRGWGIVIQVGLIITIGALGSVDPVHQFLLVTTLALLVAFLSASQDIVIDAYRVEVLPHHQQGAGAAATLAGYRLGMLASGGGALLVAYDHGWRFAYFVAAALIMVGILVFLVSAEPVFPENGSRHPDRVSHASGTSWAKGALALSIRTFLVRPGAATILLFATLFKLGDAVTLTMATPFYLSLGFNLHEIAEIANIWAFPATALGGAIGGWLVARNGLSSALIFCGLLQAAGIASYTLLALCGHQPAILAATSIAEGLTGGMAWAAFVAFLSDLCDTPQCTATQYALLSSLMAFGRTLFAAPSGFLSVHYGWPLFFAGTALINIASVGLFIVIRQRWALAATDKRHNASAS